MFITYLVKFGLLSARHLNLRSSCVRAAALGLMSTVCEDLTWNPAQSQALEFILPAITSATGGADLHGGAALRWRAAIRRFAFGVTRVATQGLTAPRNCESSAE